MQHFSRLLGRIIRASTLRGVVLTLWGASTRRLTSKHSTSLLNFACKGESDLSWPVNRCTQVRPVVATYGPKDPYALAKNAAPPCKQGSHATKGTIRAWHCGRVSGVLGRLDFSGSVHWSTLAACAEQTSANFFLGSLPALSPFPLPRGFLPGCLDSASLASVFWKGGEYRLPPGFDSLYLLYALSVKNS